MRLEGHLRREDGWWLAEIPLLDVMTQGRSKGEAREMVVDLVETMADRPGFSAAVRSTGETSFDVSGSEVGVLVAVLLRRLRGRAGLSLAEVARRLGHRSRNAYARYEQGRAVPTVEKLAELLRAVDCEILLSEASHE